MNLLKQQGVLADFQIRRLCEWPDAEIRDITAVKTIPVYGDYLHVQGAVEGYRLLHPENDVMLHKTVSEMPVDWKPMIEPFVHNQVKIRMDAKVTHGSPESGDFTMEGAHEKIISYGLSSFGYDLRLGHKFKVFSNINATHVDPKCFDKGNFVEREVEKVGDYITIPPNSFILGYSLEYLRMPDDVVGQVIGKSTIARSGINCICTPLEPGWEGHVTLEFANCTPLPARMYVGEGCCQVMFFRGERPDVTYGDRGGKYQNQGADAVGPKV